MTPGPDPPVDIMNDPTYNSLSASNPNDGGDPDHCRICRSEGTLDEPLFHPCKCSGSIKFVHQECLLEWLQHSQKKHCELCKTPFHFTKLYDPHMPPTIPTPLFLQRLIRHLFRNILVWARGFMVGAVWLGGLPWCVRWMWRGWFWLSDGGWWADPAPYNSTIASKTTSPATLAGTPTPSIAVANATSSAFGRGLLGFFRSPSLSGPVMSPINGGANATVIGNATFNNTTEPVKYRLSGIFIDPNPFHNLTRFPAVNGIIIDVLEGQLLTALIVVSFILVFLIREWVVQQQPALAAGGVGAAGAILPPPNAEAEEEDENFDHFEARFRPHVDVPEPQPPAPVGEDAADTEELLPDEAGPSGAGGQHMPVDRPRVYARPRRRRAFPGARPMSLAANDTGDRPVEAPYPNADAQMIQRSSEGQMLRRGFSDQGMLARGGASSEGSNKRPQVDRDAMAKPAETRRRMRETPGAGNGNARGASAGPTYDFGFSFGNQNRSPSPISTPDSDSDSSAESRTPARLGRGVRSLEDFHKYSRFQLDMVDMGKPLSSSPSDFLARQTPVPAATGDGPGSSRRGPREYANKGKRAEAAVSPYDNALDTEDQWEDEDEGEGETKFRDKGKGVAPAPEAVYPIHASPLGAGSGFDRIFGQTDHGLEGKEEAKEEEGVFERHPDTTASLPSTLTSSGSVVESSNLGGYHLPNREIDPEQDSGVEDGGVEIPLVVRRNRVQIAQRQGQIRDPRPAALPWAAPGPAPREMAGWWDWFMGGQEAEREGRPGDDEDADADADTDTEGEDNGDQEEGGDLGPAMLLPPDGLQEIGDEDAADDFDGIMELIGMRGPLVGLLQNAAISSVLITTTVALGVAFPYVMGKIVMIILANPIFFLVKVPATTFSFTAEFVVDSSTCLLFSFLLMLDQVARMSLRQVGSFIPGAAGISKSTILSNAFKGWALNGKERVAQKLMSLESAYVGLRKFPTAGAPPLSMLTRQGLSKVSLTVAWAIEKLGFGGSNQTYTIPYLQVKGVNISTPFAFLDSKLVKILSAFSPAQHNTVNATSTTNSSVPTGSLDVLHSLDSVFTWTVWDRVAAVFFGYAFFTVLGMFYLRIARRRNLAANGRIVEKIAVELLSQAGGVMKVVLIIGIEMLVFPLYCGLLLDLALLPLFEEATVLSRIQFFADFPLTSVFVHWFVGTCYMFHFALFVSMCRKIMRPGVLYFIRDPDDPTFHPVKDVLERPVVMQLRKIGFSALIYGVLVLLCLGGVVWTLHFTTENVLPVHWSSNEPVLEFPVDLLFYNFFMPVAVQFFRPSDGLQKMYGWWFGRCARALRLTSFMFGKRIPDEEGHHVRPDLTSWMLRRKGDVNLPVYKTDPMRETLDTERRVYFLKDGGYVRAPASDSVRRPKGSKVFIPVSESNIRLDGKVDSHDSPTGPRSPDFKHVYIPPWFRTRIGLLVLAIWGFAAITGLGVTIGPLLLGRTVLKTLVPADIKLNDIYAFSVGIYIIGAFVYAGAKSKIAKRWIKRRIRTTRESKSIWRSVCTWLVRAAKISYVVTAFGIVLPTLLALIIEFYVIIPIHTYFSTDEQHVIHFIQDWTLGVLYVKMMGRMLLVDSESNWARSLRGVVARGYLDPDVKLATRYFIAPVGGIMLAALLVPLGLGFVVTNTFLRDAPAATINQTYRYSYPAVFVMLFNAGMAYCWKMLVDSWKQSIRDEVYLTGEQLHNHGEDTAPPTLTPSEPIGVAL